MNLDCPTNHAYIRKIAPDKAICLSCGHWVDLKATKQNTLPLVMPPVLYMLDKYVWKSWNPWPRIPFSVAEKYGWYGSVIGMDDYLVMPVFRNKLPVGYSARRITDNGGKKYTVPTGRIKYPWQSRDKLIPPVLVGEGVADAAYLSQLANSVALLGTYGSFEFPVITVMDGDDAGIASSFRIVQEQKKNGFVESQAVLLPGGDPTDYDVQELRRMIFDQTGVSL